ncbi:MAG: type II toxin-antitoxin system toxin DNA ADP-ribosyl transferase DarT [Methylobacter sp.]
MGNHYPSLNPDKALIWRIVHRDNLPWILDNGLHCESSDIRSADYIHIGNPDLIGKRRHRLVPIEPEGTLADYVPFYFTPFSVMMKNIHSGWGGVQQRANDEIVILVSSLPRIKKIGLRFVFTDAHAYTGMADFYNDLADLDKIDWGILQRRDFKRDPDDPRKMERYQAEALIYQHLPVEGLVGIVCYTEQLKQNIEREVAARNLNVPVHARSGWYF